MNTYAEKLVAEEDLLELDLCFPFYDDESQERNEVLCSSKIDSEVPSVDINVLINVLERFKGKGVDRVYISTRIDHQGYYFYGVTLNKL